MKPAAMLIVIAIIAGALLVFAPLSLKGIIASFPLFQSIGDARPTVSVSEQEASVFRSIDEGEIWFPQVAIDAGRSIPSVTVLEVTIDNFNSNILYLGTEGDGMYKSVNNGQNWEKMYDRNGVLAENANVYTVAQDPRNVNRIYVAVLQNGYGMFLKSEDGGVSFVQTYITQLENYPVQSIAIHPVSSNIIYIGTAQGGFFVSEDYGETWQVLEWLTGAVTNIVINQSYSLEIYSVVFGRGLFRSNDGGDTWRAFSTELSRITAHQNVMTFALDPSNQNKLFLALANGLVTSDNGGSTWKFVDILISPNVLPVDAVAVDPRNPDNIYVGAGAFIYKSEDGGVNWSVQKLNTEKRISTIVVDPVNPQSVFLGMRNVPKR